eukprot:TRINITY_DN14783_c0_g1_i1.p1 TRINITY_DN14783_c0_g1~~TRINITY_DN14783_c0_g1_i1.p1  ORF type:complete len:144 (-),score=28.99 TRINITY_DN14783_c0_g1_i1:43-474(-)
MTDVPNLKMVEKEKEGDADVEVTWEDQQNINEFGRLYSVWRELKNDVSGKRKELQALADSEQDLMLADESEPVRIQVGEIFVEFPFEAAQERITKETERITEEKTQLEQLLERTRTRIHELRALLYARLKDSVNLEFNEDEDD